MEPRSDELDLTSVLEHRGYKILNKIGSGAYASVYRVHSEKYDRDFAAKIFGIGHDTNSLGCFAAELQVLKSLFHPNIVMIYDYFSDQKTMGIVIEHCVGGSISRMIKDGIGVPPESLARITREIMSAFCYLHSESIAHRDIKPANILLDAYGRAKIADFGLSQRMENMSGMLWRYGGSKFFCAPEIMKRERYNPFAADVWALGVTFYLFATGVLPWPTGSDTDMRNAVVSGSYTIPDTVDPEFADVIRAMLDIDPLTRQTMSAISQMPYFQHHAHTTRMHRMYSTTSYAGGHKRKHRDDEVKSPECRPTIIASSLVLANKNCSHRLLATSVGRLPMHKL